ncbi:MAG: hypothetical protein JSR83_16535 [Proteobacteria bacterium]|nr:hypothetical protein [Pseudomonadota bacterium]
MPKKTQLFLGVRRNNGQIGYLSESLTIPEFFELIRPSREGGLGLIDFSPVIEALHAKHAKLAEQSILEKYNAVFNYWQESKSYSNIQIKLPKFESLSLLANELITSLHFIIDESKTAYSHRRTSEPGKNLATVKSLENYCNIYIDALLCFIHSKASLEIESFQNDVTLGGYCDYLHSVFSELFNRVVEYSTFENRFMLDGSSLLYYIAFKDNEAIKDYTKLLPSFDMNQDLRLHLLTNSCSEQSYNWHNEPATKIEVEYRNPDYQELEAARILRDLLCKIKSLSDLIKLLKKGGVDWEPSQDSVDALKQLVSNQNAL